MNILTNLKKYKFLIFFNLSIIISYVFIISTPKLFGIDDILANTYIYNPDMTFNELVQYIIDRLLTWNSRFGEMVYFVVGAFPRWVYYIVAGITFGTFLNLIYFYTFGKKSKEIFGTSKYYISLILNYIITITIFPGFSDSMVWMGGVFNHLFDANIVLLVGIPFRLMLDNYDVFEKHHRLKYFYFFECIIAGYSTENMVPWLILFAFAITYIIFKQKNKVPRWAIPSIIIISCSFVSMLLLGATRERIGYSLESLTLIARLVQVSNLLTTFRFIFYVILFLAISNLVKKKKIDDSFVFVGFQYVISLVSVLNAFFTEHFPLRTTVLSYFFLLTIITYLLVNIEIKHKKIVETILYIFAIVITCYNVMIYKDFNEFNELRYEYILSQTGDAINFPVYDNKLKHPLCRNLSGYESQFYDNKYLQYITGNPNATKILRYDIHLRD